MSFTKRDDGGVIASIAGAAAKKHPGIAEWLGAAKKMLVDENPPVAAAANVMGKVGEIQNMLDPTGFAFGMMPAAISADSHLFHVTPRVNLPAIAEKGLLPDAVKIAEGGPHANTKAVFLGEPLARDTYLALYGGPEESAVLRVAREKLQGLEPDPHENAAWMTKNAIPPEAIEIGSGDKWQRILDWLKSNGGK